MSRHAFVLTACAACGSQPTGQKVTPAEPPPTPVAHLPIDAQEHVETPPSEPRLACPAGTAVKRAPLPDPTWFCARPDGVRHGPFVTPYPDDTPEISGTYVNGKLDGAWRRTSPTGVVLEDGTYEAGLRTGVWTQRSYRGATLGTYTLTAGTGTEKQWHENGALFAERGVKKGVLHGPARQYEADGQLVVVARYDNGKLDGQHLVGGKLTLRVEETFERGVRRDKRELWVQGSLVAQENYDRAGRLDGAYVSWRNRRVMRTRGEYDNGKRSGLWTWFDRANNKEREGNYVDGKRDGKWQEWSEGKLTWTGTYIAGRHEGDFVYYDRTGKEIGRYTLKDGTGTVVTFHSNRRPATRQYFYQGVAAGIYQELTPQGKVVVEGRYRGDLKHGTWKQWTPDGMPVLEQTWKRGKLDGIVRKYTGGKLSTEAAYLDGRAHGPYVELRDGRVALTGQYVDDVKDGVWTTYSAEGTVLLTATYKRGVLDGPWKQLVDETVLEGDMVAGRRSGTWTRTDRDGVVSMLTYGDG